MTSLLRPIIIFSIIFSFEISFSQEKKDDTKISGEAALLSQWVHRGLTQTNGDPCIQTSLWFHFGPQFKMGFQGFNVSYADKVDTHVLLKGSAELSVALSSTSSLTLMYSNNMYFKNNGLNGNTSGLYIDIYGYRFMYEQETNWEATEVSSTHISLGKTFDVLSGFKWSNQVGYSMLEETGFSNYFDIRTGLGIKSGIALYETSITATSSNELKTRGGLNVALGAKITF